MTEKSTQAEVMQRIAEVYELLLRHVTRGQIVQYGSKAWGISLRQVDKYIARAKKLLYEDTKETLDKKKNRILHELDYLYSEAFRKGQMQTCLEIKRTQAKLEGLIVDKLKVEGDIKTENHNYEYMNDEQVQREVDRLIGLRNSGKGS